MIEVSGIVEAIIILAAAGAAFLVLRPYVPVWAWFMLDVIVALLALVYILDEGPTQPSVVILTIAVLAALVTWWRELRGTRDRRQQGP